ncbi:MAG: phytoene desaturase family protein [Ilumatobacter sp.]|uniref:phytoene desaturase family protein n=1 Tax=Ilumatobacter sp. TaxID=1967498 RepID=UPI0026080834|nr:phytoene desaturase family protein [Ilumatobacter sp.]MDJ0769661.1 phytoene desaturase family protein [Ilumatobacter sp.]
MKIVIIGAGIGGLATSIRLAAAGHHVVVLERNPMVGGKFATLEEGGFTFDLGPSLLTLPHVFDELFQLAGTTLADEVELVRLDPQFSYRWPNGSTLEIPDDRAARRAALDAFSPGSGDEWARFAERAERIWEISERTFLAGPMGSAFSLLSRMRSPLDLARIDGNRTLAKSAKSHFEDPRLQQLVGRYATYSGSSPFKAPATLACIPYVEEAFGCWYVMSGLGRLRDAIERVADGMGVEIRTGVDVGSIVTDGGRVAGVALADGGAEGADVVVANVDAAHLYTDLLPSEKEAKQLDQVGKSTSGFVVCAAVRGRTEGIAHHNVFFSLHDQQEFRYLESGNLPLDYTIYACVSSVTDPSQAPPDHENWYLLVNTPPEIGIDKKIMTAGVLNRLAERGVDLRDRIDFTRTLVPADFEARYRAIGGAIYGTSSNGKRAAFARPNNVGPIDGLYLAGGSSHPGGGLPMVTISARIVADLIAEREG